jgi:hypothetical protein
MSTGHLDLLGSIHELKDIDISADILTVRDATIQNYHNSSERRIWYVDL